MFWGLIMEPKRRYTQTVKRPFHVSMAALDIFASNNEPCQVMLNFEDRHYLLCTLQKGKDVQCVLDLNFEAGNKVVFATNGDSNVHLTGYLVEDLDEYVEEQEDEEIEDEDVFAEGGTKRKRQQILPPMKKSKTEILLDAVDDYDSNDDESFSLSKLGEDSESESSEEEGADDDDEDDEDEEDELSVDEDDDDEDEEVSSLSDEEKDVKSSVNGNASKRKVREAQKKAYLAIKNKVQSPNKSVKEERTPSKQDKSPKSEINQKLKTPKGEKTPKGNKGEANQKNGSAVKTPKQPQTGSPLKRTLEGGIIVQDIVLGDGQTAKPGKFAEVYYEGRLKQNNKVFDKLRQGAGFKFRLGKQEVIKGWDVGVAGMKVGGKRRIICPPNMAYGAKGSPPQIPPNSTLVFEVELKNTK